MAEDHPGKGIVGEELERLLAQMQHQPFDGDRAFAFDRVDARHVSAVVAVPPQAGLTAKFLWISVDGDSGPFSPTAAGPDGEPVPALYGFPFQSLDSALSQHDDTVATWLIHKTVSLQLDWFMPAGPHAGSDGDAPECAEPDFLTARRVGNTFYVAARSAGTVKLLKFSNPDVSRGYLSAVTALVAAGRRQVGAPSPGEGWGGRFAQASLKHFVGEVGARLSRCLLGDAIREGFENDQICRHETLNATALAAHLSVSEADMLDIRAGQLWSPAAEMITDSDRHARNRAAA